MGRFRQFDKTGTQVLGAGKKIPIAKVVSESDGLAGGTNRDMTADPRFEESSLFLIEPVPIGPTLGAGPLSGGGMKLLGEELPCRSQQSLCIRPGIGMAHEVEKTFQFQHDNDGVGGAVVFAESAVKVQISPQVLQTAPAVFEQTHIGQHFPSREARDRAHHTNIGVTGADIAAENASPRMTDCRSDSLHQSRRQSLPIVVKDLEKTHSNEIGPVPIGRHHLLGRLFRIPAPNPVMSIGGIGDLQGQKPLQNLMANGVIRRIGRTQAGDGIFRTFTCGVNPGGGRKFGMISRAVGGHRNQALLLIILMGKNRFNHKSPGHGRSFPKLKQGLARLTVKGGLPSQTPIGPRLTVNP